MIFFNLTSTYCITYVVGQVFICFWHQFMIQLLFKTVLVCVVITFDGTLTKQHAKSVQKCFRKKGFGFKVHNVSLIHSFEHQSQLTPRLFYHQSFRTSFLLSSQSLVATTDWRLASGWLMHSGAKFFLNMFQIVNPN